MTSQNPELESKSNGSAEGNILPSSLAQVWIITRYEIRNYFRSRRFLILLVITFLITGVFTIALAYLRAPRTNATSVQALSFYEFWWQFVPDIIVVFCAVFFGGDAISGEFQNKTGYFLVGNPIRRSSIYIGKFLASLIASVMIIALFTAFAIGNGLFYLGAVVPVQFVEAILFSLVYLVAGLGFTYLFSSLFKSGTLSSIVTFILLILGFSLIDSLVSFYKTEPWFSLGYASSIIANVFIVPYPDHIITLPDGSASYTATIPEGLAIMMAYFLATILLGLFLFERKEFN